MSFVFALVTASILSLLNAFILKVYVDKHRPFEITTYGRAMKVSSGVAFGSWALSFIPWVGWLLGPILWFVVVRELYKLDARRSLILFLIQAVSSAIAGGLLWLGFWLI